MRVISQRRLREFWTVHEDAKRPLRAWYKVVKKARWQSFQDVRAVYGRTVDRVGVCYVFNIKGNSYRLIAVFSRDWHVALTCIVLTHREYNRDKWQDTCQCKPKND